MKLAQERGYVPRQITLPPGFGVGPDGQLIPQAILDSIKGAQQAEQGPGQAPMQPPAPPLMPQENGAMPQPMPQTSGIMPQMGGMPQMDPETLQQLMAQIREGMGALPRATGEPTGLANLAGLNAMSGAPIEPQLGDLAGGVMPALPVR